MGDGRGIAWEMGEVLSGRWAGFYPGLMVDPCRIFGVRLAYQLGWVLNGRWEGYSVGDGRGFEWEIGGVLSWIDGGSM